MTWEPLAESCDVCHCTRLFRNAFKIKGTPESAVKRSATKRNRRLIGNSMASTGRQFSSPELSSSLCANSQNHQQNLDCSAIFSPNGLSSTPRKPSSGLKSTKPRFPLEEFDPNSQDSGYGGSSFSDEKAQGLPRSSFRFAEPLGVAPRRLSLEARSPIKSPTHCSPQRKRPALFHSLSSGYESTDDGFNELIDVDSLDGELSRLPNGLSSLISGDIVSSAEKGLGLVVTTPKGPPGAAAGRPHFRRALSLHNPSSLGSGDDDDGDDDDDEEEVEPVGPSLSSGASRVRSCLFRSPNASSSTAKLGFGPSPRNFKRPEPPVELSPLLIKRSRKCTSFQDVSISSSQVGGRRSPHSILQRSHSETEAHAHIKSAIHRSTTDADLTGDFSKPCCLPLSEGRHEDLKSISGETLARLIRGEFADRVGDFRIVDCRYPYEFEAGHISGALNLYTKEMIEQALLDPLKQTPVAIEPQASSTRSILVFHCEFSWERGPNLSRFLRNVDRQRNKEHYPALHYPEVYLLHGGYQRFFKEQRELCSPQGYRPMRDPDHEVDLRQFRSKSKSWQGEKTNRANVVTARANLKRLGF